MSQARLISLTWEQVGSLGEYVHVRGANASYEQVAILFVNISLRMEAGKHSWAVISFCTITCDVLNSYYSSDLWLVLLIYQLLHFNGPPTMGTDSEAARAT